MVQFAASTKSFKFIGVVQYDEQLNFAIKELFQFPYDNLADVKRKRVA